MSRPLVKSVEKKLRITLAVLHGCTHGEVSMKDTACRRGFEDLIAAWGDQFLEGGRARLGQSSTRSATATACRSPSR